MTQFKIGDIVIPEIFTDEEFGCPGWVDDMLDLVGKECEIIKVNEGFWALCDDSDVIYSIILKDYSDTDWDWPESKLILSTNVDNIQA